MDLDVQRAQRAVTQYFGVEQHEIGDYANGEVIIEGIAPVQPHLLGAAKSGIRSGALLAMIDHVGGLTAGLAALPEGWVVSTNLSLRIATLDHAGPLRIRAEVLRRGRAAVVIRVRATDDGAGTRTVADAVLTSAVLVPETGPPQWQRPASTVPAPCEDPQPLEVWLGVRADGDAVEMDVRDDLRNPWGILHGAVVASLVDLAAEHAVGAITHAPVATADVVLHFLAPGRVGPVTARAEVLGERADGHVARVEVRDRGADNRVMSVATATVRGVDRGK
ncbi:MAG: uncharacterized protein JWL83_326 [Actinomycetia bacterium]|nr:uncharacterized protein [Actinomycetes bacterium]